MFVSFIGLILYYPAATFMDPNLQFVDKTLDIKFAPTYLIFLCQGKLMIAGAAVFFPYVSHLPLQL